MMSKVMLAQSQIASGAVFTDDNVPIPFANIFLLSHQQRGVVSNALGHFELKLQPGDLTDTLVVSAIGYQLVKIPLDQEVLDQHIVMKRNVLLLDEVTVTYQEKVHKILRKAMNRISRNFGSHRFCARAYYQEYSIVGGEYREFLEGIVNIADRRYVSGEDNSIIRLEQLRRTNSQKPVPEKISRYFAFDRIYTIYERMNNVRQRNFFSLEQKPHDLARYKIEYYREYDEAGDTLIEIGYQSYQQMGEVQGYAGAKGEIILRKSDLGILKISRGDEHADTYHEAVYRKIGDKYFPDRIAYKYAVTSDTGEKYAVSKILQVFQVFPEKKKLGGTRIGRTEDIRSISFKYDPDYWKDNVVLKKLSADQALQSDIMQIEKLGFK